MAGMQMAGGEKAQTNGWPKQEFCVARNQVPTWFPTDRSRILNYISSSVIPKEAIAVFTCAAVMKYR